MNRALGRARPGPNSLKPIQINSNPFKSIQIHSNPFKSIQIHSNLFKSIHVQSIENPWFLEPMVFRGRDAYMEYVKKTRIIIICEAPDKYFEM